MEASMHNEQLKEQISALVDGEHGDHDIDFLMRVLRDEESQSDWALYHQIGDILNSEDLAVPLSASFTEKMQQRLASEPIYFGNKRKNSPKMNHKVAYATAAMVALVAIFVPKFAGNNGAEVSAPYFAGQFAADTNVTQPQAALVSLTASQNMTTAPNRNGKPDSRPQMLRDPLIDSYLAAHQRYSKSMYSAVEYETGPINQDVEK